jgi:hypothetical protein
VFARCVGEALIFTDGVGGDQVLVVVFLKHFDIDIFQVLDVLQPVSRYVGCDDVVAAVMDIVSHYVVRVSQFLHDFVSA